MSDSEKPFWVSPPYILLTGVLQLDKVDPWKVDVAKLIGGFLEEMKKRDEIDFKISGNAVYTAAIIYMQKVKKLVEKSKPKEEEKERITDEDLLNVPMIRPPFRLTNRRVTLEELMLAMEQVLLQSTKKRSTKRKKRSQIEIPPIVMELEDTQARIEEHIADVLYKIERLSEKKEIISFYELVEKKTRKEIVRVFVSLLYLAARKYIDLWQEEGTIKVQLLDDTEEEQENIEEEEVAEN